MVPREHLLRTLPFRAVDDTDAGDGLTLEGYAAVFDTPTEIDSWEGAFTEKIRKGAFRKSIRERTPRIQFEHGRHPLIGSIPIGTIQELREDDDGLWTSARLTDNWLIEPVRDAISDGAINGMSFRFTVVREEWRDGVGKVIKPEELDALLWNPGDRGPLERTLIELKLHELGPVVWPAYDATSVGVRARSLAATITDSHTLRRKVRESLASTNATLADLSDSDFRREVATALLIDPDLMDVDVQPNFDAPPAKGRPSTREETQPDDASPDKGHLSNGTDAPLSDGHPSDSNNPSSVTPERIRADAEMLRRYTESVIKRSGRYAR